MRGKVGSNKTNAIILSRELMQEAEKMKKHKQNRQQHLASSVLALFKGKNNATQKR